MQDKVSYLDIMYGNLKGHKSINKKGLSTLGGRKALFYLFFYFWIVRPLPQDSEETRGR
ncbi:hypothetical protein KOY_02000 [Bacillus cereus VDM021]|nr:hypothetical protein IIW_04188 [Bacillus cereus VD136]EOP77166.1 hypothetical protein KOW_03439 [Bacillus cereus VDM006]EOQ18843.1 hypothetical protein KOY_02000 [Bacillus cereus VDM021]